LAGKEVSLTDAFREYFRLPFYREKGCPMSGIADARALQEIVARAKHVGKTQGVEPPRREDGKVLVNGKWVTPNSQEEYEAIFQ